MVAAAKTFCKMASILCQNGFKKTWVFVLNLKNILDHTISFKFHQYVVQIRIK